MSVTEIGLRPESALLSALPQVVTEQPSTDSLSLVTRYEAVSGLARSLASMTPEILSRDLLALFRPLFPCDFVNIVILDPGGSEVNWRPFGDEQLARLDVPMDQTTIWSVYQEQRPLWVVDWQYDERMAVQKEGCKAEIAYRSLCRLPLRTAQGRLGVLSLASSRPHSYSDQEVRLLLLAADQVALGMANFLLHAEVQKLKNEISDEDPYIENEATSEPLFEEIVGRSPALQRVLREVEVVAPTDSSVFIKVNCAAIPSGLLESELFGHEKGAFTGAIMRKPGRFELADKGTLFLDEVGDIPLDLQSKLLRVLQEKEFERLGSTRTQQVDVRVIAATHRNLKQMIEEGTFRSDLYYRLHVFPLTVPPLRERH